jgi:Superfamily II RNA helicase
MMLGTPTKLESQFRVTYSMLLNLLRVEQLRVEDMLQRSYVESASLRQGMSRKIRLKEVEEQLSKATEPECRACTEGNLAGYHTQMRQLVRLRSELWTTLATLPAVDKMLAPCRIVIISHGSLIRNRVALILKVRVVYLSIS